MPRRPVVHGGCLEYETMCRSPSAIRVARAVRVGLWWQRHHLQYARRRTAARADRTPPASIDGAVLLFPAGDLPSDPQGVPRRGRTIRDLTPGGTISSRLSVQASPRFLFYRLLSHLRTPGRPSAPLCPCRQRAKSRCHRRTARPHSSSRQRSSRQCPAVRQY